MSTESTTFTRDILGRYICNTLDEALRSADASIRADARPFDIIMLGGGTIGAATAQHLLANDRTHSHRILVLEGGPSPHRRLPGRMPGGRNRRRIFLPGFPRKDRW